MGLVCEKMVGTIFTVLHAGRDGGQLNSSLFSQTLVNIGSYRYRQYIPTLSIDDQCLVLI